MKLQCSCGAKYAFDAQPEMLQQPVKFICPACGLDASDFVNELIRQEFSGPVPPPPAPPPAAPAPVPRLKVSHEAAAAAPPQPAPTASKFCGKHHERATESCAVCHKPICPKCLEMFGYFCSPLCKGKAEEQHLKVPVYAGQRDRADAAFWRKTGLILGTIIGFVVLLLGVWTWYAWFGSVPHPYFSVRFEDNDRGYSGRAELAGQDQLVFLHGGTLARYDLKTKKPVWSRELITKEEIEAGVKAATEAEARADAGAEPGYHHRSNGADLEREVTQGMQAALALHVSGQNIWVGQGNTLTHYDWNTGSVAQVVTLPETFGELVETGDELQIIGDDSVTHISLASGDSHLEQFGPPGAKEVLTAANDAGGGLPGAGGDGGQALDPKTVEAQAANLKLQGRLALPAIISNARHERELENALNDDPKNSRARGANLPSTGAVEYQLVAGKTGYAQFSSQLLEERLVTRTAMKAAPKKSALDGDVNSAHTGEIANELLNEMQRNAGGDTVTEDESRYLVTVHLPDGSAPDWTNQVVGAPSLYVLKTVNVVAAGKSIIVLDKANKQLWQTTLTYPLGGGAGGFSMRRESQYGAGPCVEDGDTLYIFDQAVLSAFELNSGNARWRLPSVGVVGLFIDDQGCVYVNTTTGNPDDVKYSRQIDLTRNTQDVLLKLDPKSGKTLWSVKPGGFISYLSGKFIYAIECYDPNPGDAETESDMAIQKPAYLRITRIAPSNGHVLFDYYDRNRCPVDWHFDRNSIQLVFKREVQVLRYLAF